MNRLYLAPTTLPDTPPLEFLEAAAAARYDGVGLRLHRSPQLPFHPVVGNAPLVRAMKERLADGNLAVLDILSFYLVPGCDFDSFKASLELGAEFGAKYAMVIGDDPEWSRLRDNFARFCDAAAGFGLSAVIEFVAYRPLATLALACRIIAEAERPNVAICLDPLHFARSGGTPAELAGLDMALFPYIQLSDGVLGPGEPDPAAVKRAGAGQRRMPGEGTLPLRALLAMLPAGLPLSVEVHNAEAATMSPAAWAREAMEKSRRFLATG